MSRGHRFTHVWSTLPKGHRNKVYCRCEIHLSAGHYCTTHSRTLPAAGESVTSLQSTQHPVPLSSWSRAFLLPFVNGQRSAIARRICKIDLRYLLALPADRDGGYLCGQVVVNCHQVFRSSNVHYTTVHHIHTRYTTYGPKGQVKMNTPGCTNCSGAEYHPRHEACREQAV